MTVFIILWNWPFIEVIITISCPLYWFTGQCCYSTKMLHNMIIPLPLYFDEQFQYGVLKYNLKCKDCMVQKFCQHKVLRSVFVFLRHIVNEEFVLEMVLFSPYFTTSSKTPYNGVYYIHLVVAMLLRIHHLLLQTRHSLPYVPCNMPRLLLLGNLKPETFGCFIL